MSRVFVRSEKLAEQIFNVKLPVSEWKVLFAVDGEMDLQALASFLEMPVSEVEMALTKLMDLDLLSEVEEKGAEGAPMAPTEEREVPKEEEERLTSDEGPPLEFPSGEEAVVEDFTEVEESSEQPEVSETTQEMEAPVLPTEQEEQAPDEEFDRLIGDLIKGSKEPETPAESEIDLQKEESQEGTVETSDEETSTAEAAIEETGQKATEEEDFDFSSLLQEDLAETEQSLSELMGSLEEEIAAAEAGEEAVPAAEEMRKPSPTILVVDDSVVIRKMVEIALENENYDIFSVATGKDALKFLDENTPDLVILDIMLPDVNGLDILKAIKASKKIPVVMLSAKDTPRETTKAKELGADDFIPKPFKDEELVSKIKELIKE